MVKLTKQEFIATVLPHVLQVRKEGSIMYPSVRIAQNLLETGGAMHTWFNLGGIKVGSGKPNQWWDGASVNKGTWEDYGDGRVDTTARFRAYKSLYHFYKDQDLLFQFSRYARVRAAKTAEEQAKALYLCGYATDPQYASKVTSIINTYGLKKYDEEAEDELKLTAEQKKMLIKALNQLPIDKKWAEKAEKDELTMSELTWLNTITLARNQPK